MRVRDPAIAAVAGIVGGALLDVLSFAVAAWGPAGDGWSLRGNGALVVPLGLGPALLAGGWAALAARQRGARRWVNVGAGAGLVGALIVIVSVLSLVVLGRDGQQIADRLTLLMFGWPVIAVLVVALMRIEATAGDRKPLTNALAAIVIPAALIAGFQIAGLVVAPGSA